LTLALRTLGPALGFVLGFGCLSLYIDPLVTPMIDKTDTRWLGAWWLGWIFLGLVMLVFAALISLFPRMLPPKVSKKAARVGAPLLAPPEVLEEPKLKGFATLKI
jgi:cytochrome bd-type quinol oxidase subunit 2